MRSRGLALLELLLVVSFVFVAAVLVLRPGGRLSASEQVFVDQVAGLVARAGQEALSGYVAAEVARVGEKVLLRLGEQDVDEVQVPPSLELPTGTLVAYGPGGSLLARAGDEILLRGRTGTWRLVPGEAGAVRKEVVP